MGCCSCSASKHGRHQGSDLCDMQLLLQLLKLGSIKPFIAKAMEPPSSEAVEHAVETLISLVSVASYL